MASVLIIKNGDNTNKIHFYAEESYKSGKKGYYNSVDGTLNEQALIGLKDKFGKHGIVIMITYENLDLKEIKDVFIGDEARINNNNSIEYNMYIHLIKSRHEKVIQSIIDKIDLDVDADFGYGQYVIMSDMESLYQELRERIIASKRKISNVSINKEVKEEVVYELCPLAQKDEQSLRVYQSDNTGISLLHMTNVENH